MTLQGLRACPCGMAQPCESSRQWRGDSSTLVTADQHSSRRAMTLAYSRQDRLEVLVLQRLRTDLSTSGGLQLIAGDVPGMPYRARFGSALRMAFVLVQIRAAFIGTTTRRVASKSRFVTRCRSSSRNWSCGPILARRSCKASPSLDSPSPTVIMSCQVQLCDPEGESNSRS
jgi:hypothetical protein